MTQSRRITLVGLGTSKKEFPYMPGYFYCSSPGIHYVNAILREQGHQTSIINQVTDNLTVEEVPDRIRNTEPDIVLFNQFFIMRNRVRKIIDALGNNYIYGIGGHDATFHSLSLIDDVNISGSIDKTSTKPIILNNQSERLGKYYQDVDFIWLGETEKGIADFIKTAGKQHDPVLVYNLHNRVRDLDDLPVLQHDDYNSEIGFIVGSRGCMTMGCEFCTTPQFYPDGWRARSIQHMEQEIINLKINGKKLIYASDDNFLGFKEIHLDRASRIIEKVESLEMKFSIMTSVSQILKAEELGLLKKWAGTLVCVFLGVENPVTSSLEKFGKNVPHETSAGRSAAAIEALARCGIMPYLGYINFQPETTTEELKQSARFLHDTNMEASCFHYLHNRLNILEGTPIFNKFKNSHLSCFDDINNCINYRFNDPRVRDFWYALEQIRNLTRHIDCIQYEAGIMTYANRHQAKQTGKKYLLLKNRINEINYNLFIETLERIEKGDSFAVYVNALETYNIHFKTIISEYNHFFSELIDNSQFITRNHIQCLLS